MAAEPSAENNTSADTSIFVPPKVTSVEDCEKLYDSLYARGIHFLESDEGWTEVNHGVKEEPNLRLWTQHMSGSSFAAMKSTDIFDIPIEKMVCLFFVRHRNVTRVDALCVGRRLRSS